MSEKYAVSWNKKICLMSRDRMMKKEERKRGQSGEWEGIYGRRQGQTQRALHLTLRTLAVNELHTRFHIGLIRYLDWTGFRVLLRELVVDKTKYDGRSPDVICQAPQLISGSVAPLHLSALKALGVWGSAEHREPASSTPATS